MIEETATINFGDQYTITPCLGSIALPPIRPYLENWSIAVSKATQFGYELMQQIMMQVCTSVDYGGADCMVCWCQCMGRLA